MGTSSAFRRAALLAAEPPVVISTTPPMITAAATSVRAFSGSPASHQPSTTATAGLTKA